VAKYLGDDDPNAGLRALTGTGVSHGNHRPVDSEQAQDEMAGSIYRDGMGLDDDTP
jgi:hypothetical protein